MLDYRYAYLVGDFLVAFPVWLVLFIRRKDLWKELLLMSLAGGFLGPISELYYTRDYWHPVLFNGWKIGLEDFLFGFFVAGIAAVIYEELIGKRFIRRKLRRKHFSILVVPAILIFVLLFHILTVWFNINSIYVSILLFLLISLTILYFRHDLLKASLISGVFMGGFMFFGYIFLTSFFPDLFRRFWIMGNISGVLVRGIPIEELFWGFSWGMVAGPSYEFLLGLKLSKK